MLDKYLMRGFKLFCGFDASSQAGTAVFFQPGPLCSALFPLKCERVLDSDYTYTLYWLWSPVPYPFHLTNENIPCSESRIRLGLCLLPCAYWSEMLVGWTKIQSTTLFYCNQTTHYFWGESKWTTLSSSAN